ncbi:MAG: PstS family phosphate ABC transporter substrate-binding protein [Pseudomonadota bacterium]|nr:PstS family phosphate ABC transporter substrate-binding protein [Pseudomonadota bacterium]
MRKTAFVLAATLGAAAHAQTARDYITVVGSSTVYPFTTVVAEQFGKTTAFKTPKIESTGTGGGMKLFCEGVGVGHPDITNASRRIKASEVEICEKNGVREIVEVKIGYDGIVLAQSKTAPEMELSLKEIFLALARQVPDPQGGDQLVANPYATWRQINPELPDSRIEVLGPPPTSGTRDAFVELAMEGGCQEFESIAALKDNKDLCHTLREDGAFVEAGENDNLIVQKLEANPKAVGIFGFSFLDQNTDRLRGIPIDGVEPSFENIADGQYAVSRPLYIYVKKAHVGVIPGLKEFLAEFTSDKAWGDEGYLADKGLIPLPGDERSQVKASVDGLQALSLN